ncbi:MAG: hypothetical protein AAF268_06140, partial [Cyanobacteria bacterium P01_A01_bin.3]
AGESDREATLEPEASALSDPFSMESSDDHMPDMADFELDAVAESSLMDAGIEGLEETVDFGLDTAAESALMESTEETVADDARAAFGEVDLDSLVSEDSSDALSSVIDGEGAEAVSDSVEDFANTAEESLASADSLEEPEFVDEVSLGELLGDDTTEEFAADATADTFNTAAFPDISAEAQTSEVSVEDSSSPESMSLGDLLSEEPPANTASMFETSAGFETGVELETMVDQSAPEEVSLGELLSEEPPADTASMFEASAGFETGAELETMVEQSADAEAEAADAASLDELLGAIEGDIIGAGENSTDDPNDVDAFFSSVDSSSITELTTSSAADSDDSQFADLFSESPDNDNSEHDNAEALVSASLEPVADSAEQDDGVGSADLESLNLADLLSDSDD